MKLVITYNQYKLLDLLAYRASILSDTLKHEPDNKNQLSTDKRLFTIAAKKVDSAKIPEQVKKLVISIGNNWAKYTSDVAFLLRDAGVLVEGSTHFKEG